MAKRLAAMHIGWLEDGGTTECVGGSRMGALWVVESVDRARGGGWGHDGRQLSTGGWGGIAWHGLGPLGLGLND